MSSWSCPHDLDGICQRVGGALCDPGMRGCVLHGRYALAGQDARSPRKPVRPVRPVAAPEPAPPSNPAPKPKRRLPF